MHQKILYHKFKRWLDLENLKVMHLHTNLIFTIGRLAGSSLHQYIHYITTADDIDLVIPPTNANTIETELHGISEWASKD